MSESAPWEKEAASPEVSDAVQQVIEADGEAEFKSHHIRPNKSKKETKMPRGKSVKPVSKGRTSAPSAAEYRAALRRIAKLEKLLGKIANLIGSV